MLVSQLTSVRRPATPGGERRNIPTSETNVNQLAGTFRNGDLVPDLISERAYWQTRPLNQASATILKSPLNKYR
jgi:hypothetical protein